MPGDFLAVRLAQTLQYVLAPGLPGCFQPGTDLAGATGVGAVQFEGRPVQSLQDRLGFPRVPAAKDQGRPVPESRPHLGAGRRSHRRPERRSQNNQRLIQHVIPP